MSSDTNRDHPPPLVQRFSDLTPRAFEWLWPCRLAIGKLAMLDGDPGMGKSLIALDLCARLSTGRPFPDGTPSPGPASSLVICAEDNSEDTVRPRLHALGADMTRVLLPHPDSPPILRLPDHLTRLDNAIAEASARLVILDPITDLLDPGLAINDAGVRGLLLPLVRLAEARRCAVLMHRHLNKRSGGSSLYRGGGTIAFQAVCRSSWLVAHDPTDRSRRVLAQVKNNLAPPQPSLLYTVETEDRAPPRLSWLGPHPLTADQLLAVRAANAGPTPIERACMFLRAFLESGPRPFGEIRASARTHELSRRTLFRARRKLDIRGVHGTADGAPVVYWCLKHQAPPIDPDLAPWLGSKP
jgi:hypothetical protein